MNDILSDLVSEIAINKSEIRRQPDRVTQPAPRRQSGLLTKGAGGVIFNFGNIGTGNPFVDQFNHLLNAHADPQQMAIAKAQRDDHTKALGKFVDMGEGVFDSDRMVKGQNWDEVLSGSTDKAVEDAFKKGALTANPEQSSMGGGGTELPKGEFSKSQINLTGEMIQATSETDAALIEMMKNNDESLNGPST